MGLIVPQVRIHDEIGLPPNEYRVKIRGTEVGQGIAYAGRLLAVPPAGLVTRPDGRDGVDPVTGQPAVWIHADGREVAELAGCRVLEASAVVAGHFGEIVADHADELMTREQVERLLDRVRTTAPTLVGEVVPGLLRAGELQRVLQNLLRERVSIRDLETILETLVVHAGKTKDIDLLTELVRQSLARQITESLPRFRRPAPRRHAGPCRSTTRLAAAGQPVRDATRRGPGRRHDQEHHSSRGRGRGNAGRKRLTAGHPDDARRTRRPQGPDPRGPAPAGRPEPARNPARHARRSSRQRRRRDGGSRDDLHDHGGHCMTLSVVRCRLFVPLSVLR